SIVKGDTPGQGGTKYWQGLLRFIRNRKVNKSMKNATILDLIERISDHIPKYQFTSKIRMSRAVEMLAIDMYNVFSSQVIGRVETLKCQALGYNPGFTSDIATIEVEAMSAIEKFVRINNLLPKERQWRVNPLSSLTDSFIILTEEALHELLKECRIVCVN